VTENDEATQCDSCGGDLLSGVLPPLPELSPLIPAETLAGSDALTVNAKAPDLVSAPPEGEKPTAGQPEPEKQQGKGGIDEKENAGAPPSQVVDGAEQKRDEKNQQSNGDIPNDEIERHGDALLVLDSNGRETILTHWIESDLTLIGREDPQRDIFPDLDLGKVPGVFSQGVSRQHLRLLRTTEGDKTSYKLFIFKGSTGTQIGADVIDPRLFGHRIAIELGSVIVLGGRVWLKLVRL
jgi:hypothetical protein